MNNLEVIYHRAADLVEQVEAATRESKLPRTDQLCQAALVSCDDLDKAVSAATVKMDFERAARNVRLRLERCFAGREGHAELLYDSGMRAILLCFDRKEEAVHFAESMLAELKDKPYEHFKHLVRQIGDRQ